MKYKTHLYVNFRETQGSVGQTILKKNYIHLFLWNSQVTGPTVFLFTNPDNPNREVDDMPKITQLEVTELVSKLSLVQIFVFIHFHLASLIETVNTNEW